MSQYVFIFAELSFLFLQIECQKCAHSQKVVKFDSKISRQKFSNLSSDNKYDFRVSSVNGHTKSSPIMMSYWTSKVLCNFIHFN